MNRFRSFITAAGLLTATALGLTGCTEMQTLQARVTDQDKQIQTLREENKQFQDAYYQIKQTMDSEVGKVAKQAELTQRDLNEARNARTQKEAELADQLHTRQLELTALRTELDTTKKTDAAKIAQLQADLHKLSVDCKLALDKLAQTSGQLGKEKELTASLTKQANQFAADLKTAQKSLTDAQNATKQRDQQLAEANQKIEAAENQNKELTAKATQLQQSLDQSTQDAAKAKKLGEELTSLKDQIKNTPPAAVTLESDPELKAAVARFKPPTKQAKAGAASSAPEVRLDSSGLRILLPSDALFKKGAIVLSDNAPATLDAVAQLLVSLPDREVRVEGHTDNQPVEDLPFADNWGLGFARADRVREYLMNAGKVPAKRLTALSRSQFEPITDNSTPQGRARNRRVEIVISKKRS